MNTPEDIIERLKYKQRAIWKENRVGNRAFVVIAVHKSPEYINLVAIGQESVEEGRQSVRHFETRLNKYMELNPEVTLTLLDDSVFDVIYSSLIGE